MKINIDKIINIQGEVQSISLEVDKVDMPKNFPRIEFYKPIKLDGTLAVDNENIYLSGTLTTKIQTLCDRCTDKMIYPIKTKVTESFGQGDNESDGEYKPIESSSYIDLEPTIMETVLVALPIKLICKEDCKGLCSKCGQNLNINDCNCEQDIGDPRLEKFASLFDDKDEDNDNDSENKEV